MTQFDLLTQPAPLYCWTAQARDLIARANSLRFPETAIANGLRDERQKGWEYGIRCAIEWAKRVSPEAAQVIQENLDAELEPTDYGVANDPD